jgi:predicted esterase
MKQTHTLSRREFVGLTSAAAAALTAAACGLDSVAWASGDGRLKARPKPGVKTTATGKSALGLGAGRDGLLSMPATIPDAPMPLFVLLHGANGSAERQLARFNSIPSDTGVAVLAIDSRSRTWDAVMDLGFGVDVEFINLALEKVFGLVAVDPRRLTIGGFSDGATYGLSLGLFNGDLFPKIAAFSTGFLFPGSRHGKPRIFMSHGTSDDILPIDQCGRPVAADLRKRGYDVTFREFAGKHEVPPAIATEAFQWIATA